MIENREKWVPQVEQVARLTERLGVIEPNYHAQFEEFLYDWNNTVLMRDGMIQALDELDAESRRQIIQATEALASVENCLFTAKGTITKKPEDIFSERQEIVKGRIRVRLKEVKLPWYIKPFRGIINKFIGGEPVDVHPCLAPFVDAKVKAETEVEKARQAYLIQKEKMLGQRDTLVDADKAINKSRQKTVEFLLKMNPVRRDIKDLVAVFPQERDLIINTYIELNAFTPYELGFFDEFLSTTPTIRWNHLPFQQQQVWREKRFPWAVALRVPTPQEARGSEELIRDWKKFIRRGLLEELED